MGDLEIMKSKYVTGNQPADSRDICRIAAVRLSTLNPDSTYTYGWCFNWATSNASSCGFTSDQGDGLTGLPASGRTCFNLPFTINPEATGKLR